MGVLPLSETPFKAKILKWASLTWGLTLLLSSLWSSATFTIPYHVVRTLVLFSALWYTHGPFHSFSSRLDTLSCDSLTHANTLSSKKSSILILLLGITGVLCLRDVFLSVMFLDEKVTLGYVVYNVQFRVLFIFVPAGYVYFVDRIAVLFWQVNALWKTELRLALDGRGRSKLQDIRILHTEVSSSLIGLKKALDLNLALHFYCFFSDIVTGFYYLAYELYEYREFCLILITSGCSTASLIYITEDMVSAVSDFIVSTVKLKTNAQVLSQFILRCIHLRELN